MKKKEKDKMMNDGINKGDITDFFSGTSELTTEEILKKEEVKLIPSSTREELNEFAKQLTEEIIKDKSDEEKTSISINLNTESFINPNDIGVMPINKNVTNDVKHEDESLRLKDVTVKKRANNAKSALLKLSTGNGVRSLVNIPLWHSGFWVTIRPLTDIQIVNLDIELAYELTKIGKDTSGLVYSNYNVLFATIIFKYFKENILKTSLNLEDEEIEDYISINDMYIIAMSIAKTIYPHGFNVMVPCANNSKLNDDNSLKCDFKANVKVDIEKLLWVDKSKLSDENILLMSKRTPNSVTKEEVIKYREDLEISLTTNIAHDDSRVLLKAPTLSKYFEYGDIFINRLKDSITDAIVKNDKLKEDEVEELVLKPYLDHLYIHYIDRIVVDEAELTTYEEINEALTYLKADSNFHKSFFKVITKFINDTNICTIGVPNFVCPTCGKEQVSDKIIPLSVYEYFFILLHSRYAQIVATTTEV